MHRGGTSLRRTNTRGLGANESRVALRSVGLDVRRVDYITRDGQFFWCEAEDRDSKMGGPPVGHAMICFSQVLTQSVTRPVMSLQTPVACWQLPSGWSGDARRGWVSSGSPQR